MYWSLGNFLQMLSLLAKLVGCLKAGLGDSGKKYFKIWSSTNLWFMIPLKDTKYLDSTQRYPMWHQGAAAVVGLYMLFALLVPRQNCFYLGNSLAECTGEVIAVNAFLCENVYIPVSQVLPGVQQSDIGASQDFSKIKGLRFQFLLLFSFGLKASGRNNPKDYGFQLSRNGFLAYLLLIQRINP